MTILDKFLDVDVYIPDGSVACASCSHYNGNHKCAAFSERIPPEILDGKNDHRTPYPGDHGIQYELEE